MPSYATLIAQYEATRDAAHRRGQVAHDNIATLLDAVRQQGRQNVSAPEEQRLERLFNERERARAAERDAQARVDSLTDSRGVDDQLDQRMHTAAPHNDRTTARVPAYDRVARVGREERTYRPDHDPTGKGFLLDVARGALFSDVAANERLGRHMVEEQAERGDYLTRAALTSAFTGLVVPQYLTDMYAPATAALAPIEDIATPHELPPEGMSLNISRITTPTATGLQAVENTAVTAQDIDDTLLSVSVQTIAGQQTISRQAVERGTGIEDVTTSDLFRRYATTLDSTIINQAATGLTNVAQVTTYTSASPTAAELWPILFQSQSKLEQALSCFAVFVDQVPAAALAARTAWVSCGVACSGHGL